MKPVTKALLDALGPAKVVTGDAVAQRSNGYWDSSPVQAHTLLKPQDTADVSSALRICHQFRQSVLVHGGLTGAVRGGFSTRDDLVLSTECMNRIEQIDPIGATATLQAGVILQKAQEAVADAGFYLPVDLGARGSCTIGGNIATNAGGINVIRYGMMREQVLGLEAVLADGTVVSSMNAMIKNNAGYDLKQLFIGSEGTLGIVTRTVVKLAPGLASRNTALVALADFDAVSQLLNRLKRELGGNLSAFEVMWDMYYRGMTEDGSRTPPLPRDYSFYVVIESEGAHPESDDKLFLSVLEQALEDGLLLDAVIAKSESERRALWEIREEIGVLLQKKPAFLYDVSLPIRAMPAYVDTVRTSLRATWPDCEVDVFGHVGDGNLHFFVKPNCEGDQTAMHLQSDKAIYEPLTALAGSVSAEHGIGIDKKNWLSHSRSSAEIALMRTLKQALDPDNILNPGRVI